MYNLAGKLRDYVSDPRFPTADDPYADVPWSNLPPPPPTKEVPPFWSPLESSPDYYPLKEQVQDEAKRLFLHTESQNLVDAAWLWELLQQHTTAEPAEESNTNTMDTSVSSAVSFGAGLRLSYDGFRAINAIMAKGPGKRIPSTDFFLFERDSSGTIPALPFFAYVCKKVVAYQTRLLLEQRDAMGDGNLVERELEDFILHLMPTLRGVRKMPESQHQHYLCHATRKFFFFLDTGKRGKISIDRLHSSDILQELVRLRTGSEEEPDEERDMMGCNWFSLPIFLKVYMHYKELDTGVKGVLHREDMYRYNNGTLTPIFIDRVVDVTGISGVIDFKRFIDFVLATEYVQLRASRLYYWKMLDERGEGFITPAVFRVLLEGVMEKLREKGLPEVKLDDAVAEVVDMINPKDPSRITLEDIERSGHPHLVFSILVDYLAWHNYDSRENVLATIHGPQQ
eukprot:TRINITY_DN27853_c0_g1_i1.p1 TRINITY_DN27853_c0_g1~~TRINITY_DN27853_c0_g1_i1.p1  ORF type:complete len:454 (+),score=105.96 TRINITY_DN27853_c0_g1_i1:68-1429(+)